MEKYITLILLLVSIDIFSQVNTEYVQNAINKTDLKTYIEKLSSSSLEGRLTGSTGQRKAAEFIANRFQSLGLKIFDEDYYQKFRLIQTYWGDVYLKTNGKKLMNFEEMAFLGNIAQNNEVEKEIVFGGNGEEDQLNQINVENKVVLIFINNLRAAYEINLRLQKKNAFAVILANPKNYKQFESLKNTFKEHKLRKRLSFPSSDTTLLTASMTLNEFIIPNSRIKEIMGLSSKSLEKLVINNTIAECPSSTIAIKCERISHTLETENVIGVIEGTSNKSIILSAHYDHLGLLKEGYYPGADDNASGTASLIELAEAFSYSTDLYYNLIFLATTGEEEGLLGSKYFVSTKDFDPTSIVINFNMDMIGRKDDKRTGRTNYLYSIGTDLFPEIGKSLEEADQTYKSCSFDYSLNNSKDISGVYYRSDQYSFYQKNIPSIFFFSGLHSDYHKQTDTAKKIDYTRLQNRVRLIGEVINLIQNERSE